MEDQLREGGRRFERDGGRRLLGQRTFIGRHARHGGRRLHLESRGNRADAAVLALLEFGPRDLLGLDVIEQGAVQLDLARRSGRGPFERPVELHLRLTVGDRFERAGKVGLGGRFGVGQHLSGPTRGRPFFADCDRLGRQEAQEGNAVAGRAHGAVPARVP